MTIELAILAFLLDGPCSGYDLKRRFAASDSLHWSGNNNQIYRALTALHRAGSVSLTVERPNEGPSRKVYSLTEMGREVLRASVAAEPELPEVRSAFLVQLLASDVASAGEMRELVDRYAELVRGKLLMLEEAERRRQGIVAELTARERMRRLVSAHAEEMCRAELAWVQRVKRELGSGAANN